MFMFSCRCVYSKSHVHTNIMSKVIIETLVTMTTYSTLICFHGFPWLMKMREPVAVIGCAFKMCRGFVLLPQIASRGHSSCLKSSLCLKLIIQNNLSV